MAEGAASREGSAPPDAAGSEDDPRVGPDATSGDCVAAAPGGRWRDRRSGVALPGAAGPPADSEAALLEAARATPRRSSIIKMIQESRFLIEMADTVQEKIVQCQKAGMEFHEELHNLGAKEGLKGRKLNKATESFAWNITVLKGQGDLLKNAKNEAIENMKQIQLACLSCGLSKAPSSGAEVKSKRSLEAIEEKESCEDNGKL